MKEIQALLEVLLPCRCVHAFCQGRTDHHTANRECPAFYRNEIEQQIEGLLLPAPGALLAFLKDYGREHGEKIVEVACQRYLKRSKYEGVKPTKYKRPNKALVKKLWARQNGICARMNHPVALEDATVDEFIPRNGGGLCVERNQRMVCKSHNSAKGDNTPMEESKRTGSTILEQLPKGDS